MWTPAAVSSPSHPAIEPCPPVRFQEPTRRLSHPIRITPENPQKATWEGKSENKVWTIKRSVSVSHGLSSGNASTKTLPSKTARKEAIARMMPRRQAKQNRFFQTAAAIAPTSQEHRDSPPRTNSEDPIGPQPDWRKSRSPGPPPSNTANTAKGVTQITRTQIAIRASTYFIGLEDLPLVAEQPGPTRPP